MRRFNASDRYFRFQKLASADRPLAIQASSSTRWNICSNKGVRKCIPWSDTLFPELTFTRALAGLSVFLAPFRIRLPTLTKHSVVPYIEGKRVYECNQTDGITRQILTDKSNRTDDK